MEKKHIRYDEGQWFVVPLRSDGYALGIITHAVYVDENGCL